ncbi:MAG: HAMP domain-containing sensor histidine kinase [Candidatus Omnitrophica bacterium]|nr:HAMP domain-containing sensor histidine kinase [Candidatus Omnitrophota bacterium]
MSIVGVFFVYGLAFFTLGLAVAIYPKKDSAFRLADKMWLLAAFGIIHGINEWVDMFMLIRKPASEDFLNYLSLLFLAVSFLFLFQFGVSLIAESKNKYRALKALPAILFIGWIAIVVFHDQRILLGNIWARYLLGAPGIFLAAWALLLQTSQFREMNLTVISRHLKLAAGALAGYAVFSGLVVPQAAFFPASVLNYTEFLNVSGVPVQVLRSVCAVLITYAILRVLAVFQWETNTRVRNLLAESQKAYAELGKLEKVKDSLTQMIVHDLNNPLGIILGSVEMLDRGPGDKLSGEQKDALRVALDNISEMRDMISNLLDIGRMEEGKLPLHYENIKLDVFLKEATDALQILAKGRGKSISIHLPADAPEIRADKDILKRVIFNLVGNALKFTPVGSEVVIAASYSAANKEVLISVKDQGEGIPKEYLGRVFDKFIQVDPAKKVKRSGKGLGLTFCKMAVEAHAGKIWVESQAGKGSTFYFTIPAETVN